MSMHRVLPVGLVAVVACAGPELDTRTFEVRHTDAYQIAEAVEPYVFTDREKNPGSISVTRNLISVRETPDNLAKIERLLAQHDRPQKSVRLHFKIIQANGASGTADTAIAEVEAELRRLFRFERYRLVGEAIIGGIAGSEITQLVTSDLGIRANIWEVRGQGDSATVYMEVVLLPGETLKTTVAVPVGQTVVLGNAHGMRQGALILTVRPELVD